MPTDSPSAALLQRADTSTGFVVLQSTGGETEHPPWRQETCVQQGSRCISRRWSFVETRTGHCDGRFKRSKNREGNTQGKYFLKQRWILLQIQCSSITEIERERFAVLGPSSVPAGALAGGACESPARNKEGRAVLGEQSTDDGKGLCASGTQAASVF